MSKGVFTLANIERQKIEQYLRELFHEKRVALKRMELLGSGWHAEAWHLEVLVDSRSVNLVLKILRGERGFGHDYPADRAQVLLMAHKDFNKLPNHIRSLDVGYIDAEGNLHSVGDYEEFFILMEEAKGRPYIEDLKQILHRGSLEEHDRRRLEILVDYLVKIHSLKYKGDELSRRRLYLRRVRDLVGHGEMIFGVIDSAYPPDSAYDDLLRRIERKALEWRWKLRKYYHRLCQVHGDYHPFNIWFDEQNRLILMDRSRGEWGEAADDVSCLATNFLWYALLHKGEFSGPFSEMFVWFIEEYVRRSGDRELLEVIQPWFAFRAIVIASPLFYPENPESVRRDLLNFADRILDVERFNPKEASKLVT